MKIRDVRLNVVRREVVRGTLAPDMGAFGGETDLGVLRILTEEGIEGNAFVGSFFRGGQDLYRHIIQNLKPELIGREAADREWFWTRLRRYGHLRRMPAAWAAVDIALWDVTGKTAGLPVYHLLGAQRHQVLAYASSPYYPNVEEYVEEALAHKERGFKAYKIHPGGVPPARVKEIARRVREAVGEEMMLMVDATLLYNYREALEIGKALEELNYYWYEDPVPYLDLEALVELNRRLEIPIAVSDYPEFRFFEAVQYILKGAGRIIRSDPPKGGITGLKKTATLCEAFGLNCEVHHGGNSRMNAAALHVVLSINNCDFYEWLLPREANQFGLVEDITVDSEGYVHGPQAPGLGFPIDWELIRRLTVQELS